MNYGITFMEIIDTVVSFIPVVIIGIFCGFVSFFQEIKIVLQNSTTLNKLHCIISFGYAISSSITISILMYLLLSYFTDMNESTKMGLSGVISFLGIEKFTEICHKLIERLTNK